MTTRLSRAEASHSQALSNLRAEEACNSEQRIAAAVEAAEARARAATDVGMSALKREVTELRSNITAEKHRSRSAMTALEALLPPVTRLVSCCGEGVEGGSSSGGNAATASSTSAILAKAEAAMAAAGEAGALAPIYPLLQSLLQVSMGDKGL